MSTKIKKTKKTFKNQTKILRNDKSAPYPSREVLVISDYQKKRA